jgi:hypothetical protein
MIAALSLLVARSAFSDQAPPVQFNRDVRPILSDRCFACHGPDVGSREADLRLDQRDAAIEWAIIPEDADASEVIARVSSDDPDMRMPPADSHRPPLTAAEIDVLRRWVDEGAGYEPHWAYIPPQRPAVPKHDDAEWARTAVDRLLLAKMQAQGVTPAAEADRVTLARRLYLDLTGLPPTLEQVDAFVADQRPDAYERLVDELLVSPRFGERMASWWFDLVRFANTVGYHGDQSHRITPYRDYVIKSFNDNLPFDQFTVEQLAGDLLPEPTMWQLVATGYNRLLQTTHEGGAQDGEYRAKHLADRVRNVSEVWMGSSLGCAECHDHKFDPWAQKEFYSLGAFFADVDHHGSFEPVSKNTQVTERPPEMLAWTLPIYNEMQQLDAKIATAEQVLVGQLPEELASKQQELAVLKKQRADLETQFEPTMITQATKPAVVRVLNRGDWMDKTGEVVQPQTPAALPPLGVEGRRATRLDLARWLVSPEHPLTSRVLVNRLWNMYYGRGLAKSLIDMGSQSPWPEQPELLDWLAIEMIDSGWNVKHMVRLLVTSSAYRQSSAPRPQVEELDPDNALFARQTPRRLDAEQIRDAALAVSGLLVDRVGGGLSKPYQPAGYYAQLNFPEREYEPSTDDNQFRRAVYVHWQRQFLHPWLVAFDAPSREECTAQRPVSNTPAAALVLLNDPTFVEAARALAGRVVRECPGDDTQRCVWAWRQVTSRTPTSEESAVLAEVLAKSRQEQQAKPAGVSELLSVGASPEPPAPHAAEVAAWTSVCRVLLNLNEAITRN